MMLRNSLKYSYNIKKEYYKLIKIYETVIRNSFSICNQSLFSSYDSMITLIIISKKQLQPVLSGNDDYMTYIHQCHRCTKDRNFH